jgi:hypothetical protein
MERVTSMLVSKTRIVVFTSCLSILAGLALLITTAVVGATELQDHRSYELVAPEHQGSSTAVGPTLGPPNPGVWIAPEGGRIAYPSADGFTGASGLAATYVSTRSATGWSTINLFPHTPQGNLFRPLNVMGATADFSKLIVETGAPLDPEDSNGGLIGAEDVYLENPDGTWTWVSKSTEEEPSYYEGRSADATHIVFATRNNLVPEASGTAFKAYEWFNGAVRLVGVKPDGSVDSGGSSLGSRIEENGTTNLPLNAVSQDGSKIFFRSPLPEAETPSNPSRLYVRIDGTTTVEVSASHCTRIDCNAPSPIVYAGATPDGSKVFFTTEQQLTNDDTDATSDLYAYDLVTGALTRLSAGVGAAQSEQSEGSDVVGISDDGERVYFVGGTGGLYLSDHGTLVPISTTAAGVIGATDNCNQPGSNSQVGAGVPEMTPDGRYLVFQTGSFNPIVPGPTGPGLYRYDAVTGESVQITASGVTHGGLSNTSFGVVLDCYLRTGMTNDGSTIIFHTTDALVPQDTNDVADVYEWHNGVVGLISSGTGPHDSMALGVSADGGDIYFTTDDRLIPGDQDEAQDIYDARIEGFMPPEVSVPECPGDDCQGMLNAPPSFLPPASVSFIDPGNLKSFSVGKTTKPLTKSQKLKKALKVCKHRPKKSRKKCQSLARKIFGKQVSKVARGK